MNHLSKTLILIILLALTLTLVACNEVEPSNSTYGVYLKSASVEDGVCTVRLSRSAKGDSLGESQIVVEGEEDHFFTHYVYSVTFDGEAIFCAVEQLLTQDGTILDGAEYSTLKIVYDYDTIYKSIKSDGVHTKSGRTNTHSFEVSKGPFEVHLNRQTPRQSTWYAVLIGGAVATVVAFSIAHLVRGKYGRKTQEN